MRALEEKLPEAERGVRRYLPPGGELPSKGVGTGTLLSRVEALERAMDALLRAQVRARLAAAAGAAGVWRRLQLRRVALAALAHTRIFVAKAASTHACCHASPSLPPATPRQDTALDQQRHAAEAESRGCSGCCAIQ